MNKVNIVTHPDYPMPSSNGSVTPEWAIVRELDFTIRSGIAGEFLDIHYSGFLPDQHLPGGAGLDRLLDKLSNPGFQFNSGISSPRDPYATSLSLNSSQKLAFVVFRLSNKLWTFSQEFDPFKIGETGHLAGAYYDATRHPSNKVAYFISDGPTAEASGTYPHRFNIYVDFQGAMGNPLPVRIDPDVRHPGGSQA